MPSVKQLIVFIALVQVISAKKPLPSYMKACKANDPSSSQCMLETLAILIPKIANGDKEFNIPKLSPFSIKEADLSIGDGLTIKLHNGKVLGIETAQFQQFNMDDVQKKVDAKFTIPRFDVIGNYEVHGKVLVVPIDGNGEFEINTLEGDCVANLVYDEVKEGGDRFAHFSADKSKLMCEFKNIHFRLDNLFNGDKTLGDQTNKFLNENWQDASKELLPSFLKFGTVIIVELINRITTQVPIDDIFVA